MKGWIIYNGALRIKKVEDLVESLAEEGKRNGVELTLIKNNEIIVKYDSLGKSSIKVLKEVTEPEFIIFWDKDILLAKHLENMGYKLFNSREAIEICDNKALMHLNLADKGIRTPKTIVAPFVFSKQNLIDEYIEGVFKELGNTIIIKESYGSFGMQIYKVDSREEFRKVVDNIENRSFIMQEFIESSFGRDIRVNIVGDKVIGAMSRVSETDFRANITLGGKGTVTNITEEQAEIALKAHKALNLDYSGVDILYGKNEEPIICEVNSNLNYLSFEEATGINFSKKIIEYIKERV